MAWPRYRWSIRVAAFGDAYHLQLAALLALIVGLTAALGGTYRQAMARVIVLKLRLSEALVQLRHEKKVAEDARRDAEIANRAKTQFFAAASHDLRQPLHAMGLFAQALRERTRDHEVAPLVNSINESVDALEGLFSELLDVTRIDSGTIEVHPRHFSLGDLLRSVRLHFEPDAFEKGLALRMRGARHNAFADPLLVERILRNLVANAIRYTEDGTVLVGCRRRGSKLLLQVWDTGVGIAPEQQSRVFEEFYQVRGASVAAPGQRKGLGLGLAIVKRLADLMHAPLTLRSWPGRGTVFTLELPVGEAAPVAAAPRAGAMAQALTLEGRRIVVVEDDSAVLAGLEALLVGWGASLQTFSSVAACVAWTAECAAAEPSPDLADRRLPPRRRARRHRGPARAARPLRRAATGDHDQRQHDEPRRGPGAGAQLSPAGQTGAAQQAARDDRLQAPGGGGGAGPKRRAVRNRDCRAGRSGCRSRSRWSA